MNIKNVTPKSDIVLELSLNEIEQDVITSVSKNISKDRLAISIGCRDEVAERFIEIFRAIASEVK